MIESARTFRVFVSSTFSDLRAERNALQERVFPRLRSLCAERGARFQAIDLRWGISEAAARDRQTMTICLGEIERCQRRSPRPNFLVLLGDRYGWRPPPPQVRVSVFEAILAHVTPDERVFLLEWYERDDNARPPEYCLKPRGVAEGTDGPDSWSSAESRLREVFAGGAKALDLGADERLPLTASATHQEIAAGALTVEDASEHVFCFFRSVENLPRDERAAGFLDLDETGRPDQKAKDKLNKLKRQLRQRLPNNVFDYTATWENGGPTHHHLEALCQDVFDQLSRLIILETATFGARDDLDLEVERHRALVQDQTRFFVGQADALDQIAEYLSGPGGSPLVIVGPSGCGKTVVMAEAAKRAVQDHAESVLVIRFLGSTPDSSSEQKVLEGVCRQSDRMFGRHESPIPAGLRELEAAFADRLNLASDAKPLILFVDALDQLSATDRNRGLSWIRASLPPHVRMVVSTVSGSIQETLEARLEDESIIRLPGFPMADAEVLLDLWLADARRTLTTDQRQRVLARFAECPNPLFLRLGFGEARCWKSSDDEHRQETGGAGQGETVPLILRRFFRRLSSEARHGSLIVSHALAYLAAARHGLTEDEVLDLLERDLDVQRWFLQTSLHLPEYLGREAARYLATRSERTVGLEQPLGQDGPTVDAWLERIRQDPDATQLDGFLSELMASGLRLPLPTVLWSRLSFDLEPYLAPQSMDGTVTYRFFHRQVQEVVAEDYLGEASRVDIHRALASYFMGQNLEYACEDGAIPNRRMLSELPFHQARSESWADLTSTLSDFPFLLTKLRVGGPQPLVEDFEEGRRMGCPGRSLPLLQMAIRRSANTLAKDPSQLPGHLIGRLIAERDKEVQRVVKQAEAWAVSEWLCPLTPNLSHLDEPLLRTLDGHTDAVTAVASLPDGNRVLSASMDGTIRLWDVFTGEELVVSDGPSDPVNTIEVFPNGRRCVSGAEDGSITLRDTGTLREIGTLQGHDHPVLSMAILEGQGQGPDQVVSGSADGIVRLWDVGDGSLARTLRGHTGAVNAVAIFAEGTRAVTGSSDRTLRVWDLGSGETIHVLEGHDGPVTSLVVLPDGNLTLSAQGPSGPHVTRNLKLWNLATGTEVRTLPCRMWGVNALELSADAAEAFAAISDGTIKRINLATGRIMRSMEGHTAEVQGLRRIPGRSFLVSASRDRTIRVWDLKSHSSLDAEMDLSLPEDLRRLQARRNRPMGKGTHALSTGAVAVFSGRMRAASITSVRTGGPDEDEGMSRLAEWDLATGLRVRSFEFGGGNVRSLSISPDGRRAIITSNRASYQVLDLESGTCSNGPRHNRGVLTDAVFLRAGKFAAAAGEDGTILVFPFDPRFPGRDLVSPVVLSGHRGKVSRVVAFPDDRRLVSGSADGTLIIWDLGTMKPRWVLEGHEAEVTAAAVLAGGRRIASGDADGGLNLWDSETGRMLESLEGHDDLISGLAPFGRPGLFVSASHDKRIKVWDAERNRPTSAFIGEAPFNCCTARLSGNTVVAGDDSGRVHLLRHKEPPDCPGALMRDLSSVQST